MEETGIEEKEGVLAEQIGGDHYKKLKIQPVEFIDDVSANFFQGNVIKYITRYLYKGRIADLEKAKHYIKMIKEFNPDRMSIINKSYIIEELYKYTIGNDLNEFESEIIRIILLGKPKELDKALDLIDGLILNL